MATETIKRGEVLKDSEATLREVAGILLELWDQGAQSSEYGEGHVSHGNGNGNGNGTRSESPSQTASPGGSPTHLGDLISVLMETYREINAVLDGIKKGRGILQQAAVDRVKKTHAKLAEVTTATEVAATSMLDGLDRALALVDQIVDTDGGGEEKSDVRSAAADDLRDELYRLMSLLQFQDITAQQLAHAAGVMAEVEERLESLTRLFNLHRLDPNNDFMGLGIEEINEEDPAPTYDPAASTENAESRQAVADDIFT